ncbi:MAG TPA: sugar ABC transporter ATP-binding protein [Propionicimonas sp.]|jgi:ABC-type sugar transport system ATPase subunit|uniref:sugar ABC transporter ATP-binding protein n=1 Tax=Propionicimonas sp. TaxID=1955623 RepID=UPI002F41CC57
MKTDDLPRIQARGVTKIFAGVPALDNVDLTLHAGEVVGLLGENGAGKSTLIKVLAGVYIPEHAEITVRGDVVRFAQPIDALARGIATVHQHSSLANNLTVAQNLILGREPGLSWLPFWIRQKAILAKARAITERFGIDLPLTTLVDDLSVAQKQRVEIVRAAAEADTLIILDEPTAALNPHEVDELFELIATLKATGIPVLYVSHRLDEIPRICDRVEVLRDGKNVGGLNKEDSVPAKIIPLLVGRQLGNLFPDLPTVTEQVVFRAENVAGKLLRGVSMEIHAGEIVGLTGAIGAGQRDFARIVFGADPGTGRVELLGKVLPHGRPDLAVKAGVGYVSGDRKKDGLFPILPVWRNATVVKSEDLSTAGFILPARERKVGIELIKQFDVRTSSANKEIGDLSGGNQQKALLARWAAVTPKLLILDEPTLGVDVGARREIYDQIVALANTGMAVILVSADHAELQGMSHRVMVFTDGEVVAEMAGKDATEEAVLHARIRTDNAKAAS